MKQTYLLRQTLSALLLLFVSSFSWAKFYMNGIYYNTTGETTVEVTYEGRKSQYEYNYFGRNNIVIPSTVTYGGKTYNVTSIGWLAFANCTATSIVIPESVTSIGESAFCQCYALTSIDIPEGVTSIREWAFAYCQSLTSIDLPNSLTSIGEYAFCDCRSLTSINIPEGVTSIKQNTFIYCHLKSITIGSGVKEIASYALSDVTKVIWLAKTPPQGASNVKACIHYVSNNAFSLPNQRIYPYLSSRFEVDNIVYVPVSPSERTCDVIDCNYKSTSTEIVIDSIVKNRNVKLKVLCVNDYSFYKNSKITQLTINNNGTIGDYAFYDCDALTSVSVNNKGSIGKHAFYGCKTLVSVSLGKDITTIGSHAFYGNNSLDSISIPDKVSSVGRYAFSGCTSLKHISIGGGLHVLPDSLFAGCSSLPFFFIPKNILKIEDYVFSGCANLGNVTFEESNSEETSQYFDDWTSTNHDHSSSSSHEYSITVQAGDVLSFNIWSDSEKYDVLEAYLDETLVATICGRQQTQYIEKKFDTSKTISLKVLYKKDDDDSSGNDEAGIRDVVLNSDNSITLGSNGSSPLFSSCKLNEVFIGRKIRYRTSPFDRNKSLRKVTITNAETRIYDNEFYGCSNLQGFSCGDGVVAIGKRAFSGCSAMESYASGTNVESIGEKAFSDCTALTSFTSNAKVPPVCGAQALDDINKWECTLYVPSESIGDYQSASQWKDFFFIETSYDEDNIADVQSFLTSPIEVYNLSGVKVGDTEENLPSGVYIKRQRNKSEKIMIR